MQGSISCLQDHNLSPNRELDTYPTALTKAPLFIWLCRPVICLDALPPCSLFPEPLPALPQVPCRPLWDQDLGAEGGVGNSRCAC